MASEFFASLPGVALPPTGATEMYYQDPTTGFFVRVAGTFAAGTAPIAQAGGIVAWTAVVGVGADTGIAAALAAEAEARLLIDGITAATATTTDTSQAVAAALAAEGNARLFDGTTVSTLDEQQVVLLSQFYGA